VRARTKCTVPALVEGTAVHFKCATAAEAYAIMINMVKSKAGPPLYIISAYISYRPIYRPYMRLVPYLPYMAVGPGRLVRYIGREELQF
jgi:hypothetical protein